MKLGIIDEVIPEPAGGNNWAPLQAGETLKNTIEKNLGSVVIKKEDLWSSAIPNLESLGKFIESPNLDEIYPEIPNKTEKLKLALITGATKGIGRSTAFRFANAGWDLILLSRDLVLLEELKQELSNTKNNYLPYQM